MPVMRLPGADLAANWAALQSDGVTPSAALSVLADNVTSTPAGDQRSVRIVAGAGSTGHIARLTVPAQDLNAYAELRCVLQGSRASGLSGAGGSFYAELRLGSAAMPVGAPGNTWHRRLPLTGGQAWDLVRLSLDDLPAAVRGAVTAVEVRALDATAGYVLGVDDILAVLPGMVADAEQALLDRLHLRFVLAGNPVPAQRVVAGAALPAARPLIAILPLSLRMATERNTAGTQRCDHVADGYRVRPAPRAYELAHAIEALADTRAEQAAITDWLLSALPWQGTLRVAGQVLALEQIPPPATGHELQPVQVPRSWLAWRTWAWQDGGAPTPVRPAENVATEVDWKEPSHA